MTLWVSTDRPREEVGFDFPLPGVDVWTVRESDRCWGEYHEKFTLCAVAPTTPCAAEWQYSNKTYTAYGGVVMAMQPGEHHLTVSVSGPADFVLVRISPEAAERTAREIGARGHLNLTSGQFDAGRTASAIESFHRLVVTGTSQLELEHHYYDMVKTFVEECMEAKVVRSDPVRHPRIRRARDYLREHADSKVSHEDLARECGLSASHVAHAFREFVGLAPHEYQRLVRVSKARDRLEAGDSPTRVAYDFGFCDLGHFSRDFKRTYGVGPKSWFNAARSWPKPLAKRIKA